MSHYDAQLEQIEAERAARRAQTAPLNEAALERAIAQATPISTRDILAAMASALAEMAASAERIVMAVERMGGAGAQIAQSAADWPDAPHPGTVAPTYTETHRRALIADLHELCWPQCAISRNEGDRTLSIRLPNTDMALRQISDALGHIGADALRALLASFPCYAQDATRISITFPMAWALSA